MIRKALAIGHEQHPEARGHLGFAKPGESGGKAGADPVPLFGGWYFGWGFMFPY